MNLCVTLLKSNSSSLKLVMTYIMITATKRSKKILLSLLQKSCGEKMEFLKNLVNQVEENPLVQQRK
jgi:hypothetical protein